MTTVLAKGSPKQDFPRTNPGSGPVNNDGARPGQGSEPKGPSFFPGTSPTVGSWTPKYRQNYAATPANADRSATISPATPPPTGPTATTRQPFNILATDLDYFKYEDESNEAVGQEITGSKDNVSGQNSSASKQEIIRIGCDCPCPAVETPVTPTVPTAETTTPTKPTAATTEQPLDEIAELEKAIQKMCSRLRTKLEESARRVGRNLGALADDCKVTFAYEFDGNVWNGSGYVRRTDYVNATNAIFNRLGYGTDAGVRYWYAPRTGIRRDVASADIGPKLKQLEDSIKKTFSR